MNRIAHSSPWITEADVESVARVVRTRMLAQGAVTRQLEQDLGRWVGMQAGVAVASGSAAVLLALRAIEVASGDEVILPTYVCRSVLEAVLSSGARPVLCDVGPDWVVEPANVKPLLSSHTRCIVIPHMYGIFADVTGFRGFGVRLIEDCAQAVAGSGEHRSLADIAVFSLHPTKCLTAGEGGVAASSDPELFARMRSLRDGEQTRPRVRLFSPLSDIAAGLALSQMARYGEFIARRAGAAAKYAAAIEAAMPDALNRSALARSMHFRFVIEVPGGVERYGAAFEALGITVRRGVDELLHRTIGLSDSAFPSATTHFQSTISLPIHPGMTDDEIARCARAAEKILTPGKAEARLERAGSQWDDEK